MEKEQSAELAMLFSGVKNAGNLDYVTGWYKKAAEYIQGTQIECAFVSKYLFCAPIFLRAGCISILRTRPSSGRMMRGEMRQCTALWPAFLSATERKNNSFYMTI